VDAEPLLAERLVLHERCFVELVVWRLPQPVPGCSHDLKYRLAYVVDGTCVVRYDNEAGKGDHRHVNGREAPYVFDSLEALQVDFWTDVAAWEASK
jgi:Family of unknown function (DUF6516)